MPFNDESELLCAQEEIIESVVSSAVVITLQDIWNSCLEWLIPSNLPVIINAIIYG